MSSRCSPLVFSEVLVARKIIFITAHARKIKRSARMLAKTIRYPNLNNGNRIAPKLYIDYIGLQYGTVK